MLPLLAEPDTARVGAYLFSLNLASKYGCHICCLLIAACYSGTAHRTRLVSDAGAYPYEACASIRYSHPYTSYTFSDCSSQGIMHIYYTPEYGGQ